MHRNISFFLIANKNISDCFAGLFFIIVLLFSCNGRGQQPEKELVNTPQQMDEKVKQLIANSLKYAISENGQVGDSLRLLHYQLLTQIYKERLDTPCWSSSQKWLNRGDSLLQLINQSKLYGLFPSDYHNDFLQVVQKKFLVDSLMEKERKDAVLWANADLMLSDALIGLIKDIKIGRLPIDSIFLNKDSVLKDEFIMDRFKSIASGNSLASVIGALEPKHYGYHQLKAGIKKFLDTADFKDIASIPYLFKNLNEVKPSVVKRLIEIGYIKSVSDLPDSLKLAAILKKYQKDKGLTVDGKIGSQTIRELNLSDKEKFSRIAITLDRYKSLPDQMPEKYIWVNIPSFNLKLISHDSIIISSRIVVGKKKTRTPVLNSAVSEMITYPQWNIPQSIIVKEILPALKKDPGYLDRKGYGLFDREGEEVDPYSVDWSKFNKGIPYKVIQGSGDDNALGIFKFNFYNKYAVYLHDTNQRYYFGLNSRALSHGCVRVQEWEKLAFYILDAENLSDKSKIKDIIPADSVKYWLANKEKHIIPVRNKIPVYIRYFSCEGNNEKIIFFEDVYDEDKELATRFFANKKLTL